MNVTIVGAGVAGCAIAWELASRGASVQVVDPRGIGRGATYASAGILAPRIEGRDAPLLRLALCSLGLFDGFVTRLRTDAGVPIEYERSGTLQVAFGSAEAEELTALAGTLAASHIPHSWLDGRQALRVEPGLASGVAGALFVPEHGYIAVPSLIDALVRAAERRGVRFVQARVDGIRGGAPPHVDASVPIASSDVVVLAAGSWSSDLAGVIRPAPVRPIRGQLLHLRMASRGASRVLWGKACYIVPWHDGTVLVGATVEDVGFDENATVAGVQQLTSAAVDLVPALASATFAGVRVGLRPMTADELPIIGASSAIEGLVYATGHYRNGILLAPLTALLVSDLVMNGRARTELSLTRPDRLGL